MKSIRSLAHAVALASLMTTASFAAHAAELPLGSEALQDHISTQVLAGSQVPVLLIR